MILLKQLPVSLYFLQKKICCIPHSGPLVPSPLQTTFVTGLPIATHMHCGSFHAPYILCQFLGL